MARPPQGATHLRIGYPAISRLLLTPRFNVKTRVTSWEGDKWHAPYQTRAAGASPFPLHRYDIRDIDFHCRSLLNQTDPDH